MALGLRIFVVNFCFPDTFWINFADIEMKLGMIVYIDKLQIKFEFHRYLQIIDFVWENMMTEFFGALTDRACEVRPRQKNEVVIFSYTKSITFLLYTFNFIQKLTITLFLTIFIDFVENRNKNTMQGI